MASRKQEQGELTPEQAIEQEQARSYEQGFSAQQGTFGAEGSRPGRSHADQQMQELVDRILALPVKAQLGIIRTLAPRAIAALEGREQGAYMRDLFNEINDAIHGQATYDVRPEPH